MVGSNRLNAPAIGTFSHCNLWGGGGGVGTRPRYQIWGGGGLSFQRDRSIDSVPRKTPRETWSHTHFEISDSGRPARFAFHKCLIHRVQRGCHAIEALWNGGKNQRGALKRQVLLL